MGINNITNNITMLSTIDPFSISSGVNVWDFYPPMISCPDVQRLGRLGDGGKWLCGITYLSTLQSCIVYSFGISTDASFEEEVLKSTNCIIYAFDPSVGSLPKPYLTNETRWDEYITTGRIIFNKVAVDTSSGSNSRHSLTESFYDIMYRLKHSYIDILKVDIEGAEWNFFDNLFDTYNHSFKSYNHNSNNNLKIKLPVGQLLIELHYQDMLTTNRFFYNMKHYGFYSYSREINLQPCLSGGKPFAVEYSFININNILMSQLDSHISNFYIPAPKSISWHDSIKGVVYILTKKSRFDLLKYTLSQYYKYIYLSNPVYPMIIFHEDLESYHIRKLRESMPSLSIKFVRLKFALPDFINASDVPPFTTCSPNSSSIGYRHMCRFHSYLVYNYISTLSFDDLLISSYNQLGNHIDSSIDVVDINNYVYNNVTDIEYLFRIDDDSLFSQYIGYDLFKYMKANNKLYGFVNIVTDDSKCVIGLWNKTKQYISSKPIDLSNGFFNEWKEPNVFYNNFEISHVSIWFNQIYRDYVKHIDGSGGIYYYRWGDAPIHTIGLSLFMSKKSIHSFSDVSYQHNPFINQLPSGLPIPNIDPFLPKNSLDCKYYSHWICTNSKNVSTNVTSTSYDKIDLSTGHEVLYSFGHSTREMLLAKSIVSFFINYAEKYNIPFVIFYSNNSIPSFNQSIIDSHLSNQLTAFVAVRYIGVTLADIPSGDRDCTSMNAEVRGASYFLRYQYIKYLSMYGYTWYIRFADSSNLNYPINYNIANRMLLDRKKYGFISAVREHSKCVNNYWNQTKLFCESTSCSELLTTWPEHVVYFNNFEVSHISVWTNELCQGLQSVFQLNDTLVNKSIVVDKFIDSSINQGDAVVHTMCVLISLSMNDVIRFDDIDYSVHLNPSTVSSTNKTTNRHTDKAITVDRYLVTPLVQLDKYFYPKTFGWLGGDVAASIRLPDKKNDRYIWLFGDSLVGTSDRNRRLDGKIVANTIAISTITNYSISSVRFYWGEQIDGTQTALFILNRNNSPQQSVIYNSNIYDNEALFWPLGGLSAILSPDITRLAVIGQFVIPNRDESITPLLTDQTRALEFQELSSTIVIVENPLDSIDSWIYKHAVFPDTILGSFKWFGIAEDTGQGYVSNSSKYVYLLGSFSPTIIPSSHTKFDFFEVSTIQSYQVVSRILASDITNYHLNELEILCYTKNHTNVWIQLYNPLQDLRSFHPKPLFSPRITEGSLHYISSNNRWLIVSLQIPQTYVQMCTSVDISGPWTCELVMTPPSPWNNANVYVTYAAKYHPELSSGSSDGLIDIVISIVPNTIKGFSVLFDEVHRLAYSPKFYRIQLKTR